MGIASPAWGQVIEDPEPELMAADVEALMQALDDELAALDTGDCAVACKALESMIRSADRVCQLDPGPPCEKARAKVEAARRKVRDACPDCMAAAGAATKPPEPTPAPGTKRVDPVTQELPRDESGDSSAASPPAESERGGCATCELGSARSPKSAPWAWLAGALVVLARRRRARPDRA